ncbi:LysM peptidoglycan-binding domain-containing protein [Frankia sp. AgPm24]|uniref:LysM peptidoglycan-binding domain-containing protein n=1 Tax=Frankia sp. AgPm24 TaxID=631128 RepID=UPI00200E1CF0|nr:LysM peptidoglycan-binding domain-containing protein [Frankia sp. AgPm24]MCK9920500.1 LysM peptidoglycan-binding domain-containing protein [Frankia sp. AgPm24]
MSVDHATRVVDLAVVRAQRRGGAGGWACHPSTGFRGAMGASAAVAASGGVAGSRVGGGAEPPLRLTRRGRAVVVAVIALCVAAALTVMVPRASLVRADEPRRGHLVVAGETLREIAVALDPDADTGAVVDRLMRVNHLSSPDLVPGEFLLLE